MIIGRFYEGDALQFCSGRGAALAGRAPELPTGLHLNQRHWRQPSERLWYRDNQMLKSPAFFFACWLCAIAVVGLTRFYDTAPPQMIGLTIAGGTLILLGLTKFTGTFGAALAATSTEQLICWHAIRAPIGAAFLIMAQEGLMPDMFAQRAGYGDLVAAFLGLAVIVVGSTAICEKRKTLVYVAWNIIGLADLLLAVGTGIYLGLTVTDSMIWIARLPLLLVPTIILPVLFSTHLIMLGRLLGRRPTSPSHAQSPSC